MKRASTVISVLAAIIIVAFPQGCAAFSSKELTRQRALALIRGHKDFKSPAVVLVRDVEKFNVPALSEDEEPVPYERAVERYFENYPEMGALRALGLVEAEVTLRDRPQMLPATRRLLDWRFSIDARLTAKGREAVRAAGGSGEETVPLFRREVLEITGLRKESATRAQADFTWKAVPTPVGEAFNPNSATFRNLPEGLRQKISRPTIHGDTLKLEFGDVKRATAHFVLYDDGWRLESIR
jgi:hypothetical protein